MIVAVGTALSKRGRSTVKSDVIVKSAFDWKLAAHALHFETAGLLRTFKVFNNLVTPNATNATHGRLRFGQSKL